MHFQYRHNKTFFFYIHRVSGRCNFLFIKHSTSFSIHYVHESLVYYVYDYQLCTHSQITKKRISIKPKPLDSLHSIINFSFLICNGHIFLSQKNFVIKNFVNLDINVTSQRYFEFINFFIHLSVYGYLESTG